MIEEGLSKAIDERIIKNFSKYMSEMLPIDDWIDDVKNILARMISAKSICFDGYEQFTGLVIAGFGLDDYLPSYVEYKVFGQFPTGLCYSKSDTVAVSYANQSWISTFAQDNVIQTFLNGIDPILKSKIQTDITGLIDTATETIMEKLNADKSLYKEIKGENKKLVEDYMYDLDNHTYDKYLRPAEIMLSFLSKDEMASLAESMISFMSLRKRVSREDETVGGPVDVAILSRGEGFIWIKRKLYFNREFNPFYRRSGDVNRLRA